MLLFLTLTPFPTQERVPQAALVAAAAVLSVPAQVHSALAVPVAECDLALQPAVLRSVPVAAAVASRKSGPAVRWAAAARNRILQRTVSTPRYTL